MPSATTWTRPLRVSSQARVTLVCLPHGGGNAGTFSSWTNQVPDWLDLVTMQYPGRHDRLDEPGLQTATLLIGSLTTELLALDEHPVALYGHSLGGLLAHQVAVRMQLMGRAPALLAVAGTVPAHRRPLDPPPRDREHLRAAIEEWGGDVEALDHPDLQELVWRSVEDDTAVFDSLSHRPLPPLSCPVLALAGTDDAGADPEAMRSWQECTTGDFVLQAFEGRHFFTHEHTAEVIAAVVAQLA